MRRLAYLVTLPAALVVGALAVFLVLDDAPLAPRDPVCQVAMSEALQEAVSEGYGQARWQIYKYDGTATAPRVVVTELGSDLIDQAGFAGGCELDIRNMPKPGATGLDWRIGRVAANAAPFRGRRLTARFLLRAERPGDFASATVYIHDGRSTPGTGVNKLGPDWTPFEVAHTVADDAKTFEIWFRLLIDTPGVSPEKNTIQFAVALE